MSRMKILQSHIVHHADGKEYEGKIEDNGAGFTIITDIKETFIPYVQINRVEKRFGQDDTEDDS